MRGSLYPEPETGLRHSIPTANPRVTVEEAARLLELSGNAVRKRLERGSLRGEKVDGVRYVLLDNDMSQHSDNMPGNIALMQAHLNSLQKQVDHLQEQLAESHEANRENTRIIAGLVQRVPELESAREASPEPREAHVTASGEEDGTA